MNTNANNGLLMPTMGGIYFMITYVDQELKFPLIRSVIYIGKNLFEKSGKDEWYFQDVISYENFGSATDISDAKILKKVDVHRLQADGLALVFDYERLVEELNAWKLRTDSNLS